MQAGDIMKVMTKRIMLAVSEADFEKLEDVSASRGLSKSAFIRYVIVQELKKSKVEKNAG